MLHVTYTCMCLVDIVRKYKRKTTVVSYSDRQLRDAIAAVKGGRSIKVAVKDYDIPKRTEEALSGQGSSARRIRPGRKPSSLH